MSRKLPKKYKPQQKSAVTEEDKRQVRRIMIGIAVGLAVVCLALVGWNAYVNNAF